MYFINDDCQRNKDMFNIILKIGEIIEKKIKINYLDRDLTLWSHLTESKTPQLLIVEYSNIEKINDEVLDNLVEKFLNDYGKKIYLYGEEISNKDYDNWLTNNYFYISHLMINKQMQVKVLCHLTYIIKEINDIISTKNLNFETPIALKSYIIDFGVKDKNKFILKTFALLYNILNKCYTTNIHSFIELDKNESPYIKYYTEYISAYAFFEMYRQVRTSQLHTIGQGVFKSCKQCGLLFYNKRKKANCCGSKWCKKKRGSQDGKNHYWRKKSS